ncbi:MAG: hypothetical protein CME99_13925 [Hyphomonas sp.]|mgnify:FL=1|uniref:NADH:ubiquinone oxidoreductase intermediate-associated protein 30 domain-containing protein n=2 Tax=Hyphomonas atlantica TaxID=1280948 RepID=A0A059EAJ4_9PROT|nr:MULTISPECIES: hypothetical protein [Hyphomonas]KCZ64552.1 hypothetical protein HY36_13235 [Hyphomonas atlantica]MAH94255.1 hypothetical protein [Hyphomonas sp.]HBH44032.1 hypothetical protein [Hyphomonas atlantica]|tara:strand:+ start:87 stop:668 length:582 start_codon:yes stop_codon:yes gene_type:complete
MKDRIFFPLALLLLVGMVLLAIWPAFGRLPDGSVTGDGVNYDQITIEGAFLNKVVAGGDATTELVRDGDGDYLLFIEAQAGMLGPEPEEGPHFQLASDLEVQFSGRRIRSTVRMRPADQRGAMQAKLIYSVGRDGDSGWQTFDLEPEFQDFSFEYIVPDHIGDQAFDYFAIRPVVPEKTRALLVESIVFERLD